jgi:hypothetical protein
VVVLTFFFLWPAVAAFHARSRSRDPAVRQLCAALGASAITGMACSATFDSLSFPMFVMVEALMIGLIGAVWLLVDDESARRPVSLIQEG